MRDIDEIRELSDLGALIYRIREMKGWTQETLSGMTGFAQSIIACYETNRHEPKISTINRMLRPLGWRVVVTLDEITEDGDGHSEIS